MELEHYRGIFPAGLTVFDSNDKLDEEATGQHWEWLLQQGIDGLVVAGTSGEFIALEKSERVRLFRLAQEVIRGRVPVVCGAGHYATRVTIDLCQSAQENGADSLIIILPYYQRPPKEWVWEHFREVRRAVDLPVMLYNNPANTACEFFSPREIVQLVDEGVVQGVKSTFESVVPVHDLNYLAGDRLAIFYGSFLSAYEAMAAGAHGWISGILNVVPRVAKLMRSCLLRSDLAHALSIWKEILAIVHLYTHHQLGPASDLDIYRAILKKWGLGAGYSRRPLQPLSPEQDSKLDQILRRTGWIDPEQKFDDIMKKCG